MITLTEETVNRLIKALDDYGYPWSDFHWEHAGNDAPVNQQAAREARELHIASRAFIKAVNMGKESLPPQANRTINLYLRYVNGNPLNDSELLILLTGLEFVIDFLRKTGAHTLLEGYSSTYRNARTLADRRCVS